MRIPSRTTMASLAAAAFILVGCERQEPAEELQANEVYGDIDFEEPGNDASAVEMAQDQPPEQTQPTEGGPVVGPGLDPLTKPGESKAAPGGTGAATDGESTESNVSGM